MSTEITTVLESSKELAVPTKVLPHSLSSRDFSKGRKKILEAILDHREEVLKRIAPADFEAFESAALEYYSHIGLEKPNFMSTRSRPNGSCSKGTLLHTRG